MSLRETIEQAPSSEAAIVALSEAFYPATPLGLARRLREIPHEIYGLKCEMETIERTLLKHCQDTGEVLAVRGGSFRAGYRGRLVQREYVEEPYLQFERTK